MKPIHRVRTLTRLTPVLGVLWFVVSVLTIVATTGCTTVHPPHPKAVVNPRRAYVLHSASHAGLAIPDATGRCVAWGFGDRLYMISKGPRNYVWGPALFIIGWAGRFTPGALERVSLHSADRDGIAAETGMSAHLLIVDGTRADQLSAKLETEFAAKRRRDDHDCIHDATDRYSMVWNGCGTVVARWCRELGADVSRYPLAPRWGPWSVKR